MGTMEAFLAYADDFEKTFADDDWSRLTKHFTDDAVYRVESDAFGCELTGPDAIFAGMKKSLDNFDRRFEGRRIDILGAPDIDGEELRVSWTATYSIGDHPDFVLRGKSMARVTDGKVALLVDSYDDQVTVEAADWMKKTGFVFNASYV